MNTRPTAAQREYLGKVKNLPCSVCGAPPQSEAHHIKQSTAWTCIPLCTDCHRGSFNGWHGQKRAWTLRKMDELDALAVTIEILHKRKI